MSINTWQDRIEELRCCERISVEQPRCVIEVRSINAMQAEIDDLRAALSESKKDKLSRLDRECLRIGQEIQRAAGELPEFWTIRIEIECGAGAVELYDDEFNHRGDFNDHVDGFSYSIAKAIDSAKELGSTK